MSHASEYTADEVAQLSEECSLPFVATHSNAYSVHPHRRNLRDRHIDAINRCGGLIGLNLCPHHLSGRESEECSIDDVMRHAEYYLLRGCENTLALGCDLDGTTPPHSIENVSDIYKIAEAMAKAGFKDELIEKIIYKNADNFIKMYLK